MIGKILLLATVAVANARHVTVEEIEGVMVPHELCPADTHHLLPHEWDCTKFYYCEYGKKFVTPRDCAPGTEFSYRLQVCVHPRLANCRLTGVPPSSEESDESSETTEVGSTEAATLRPAITTEATTSEVGSTEAATLRPAITTEATTTEVGSTEAATLRPAITTEATTTEVGSTEAATLRPAITTEATTTVVGSTEAATLRPAITTEATTTEVGSTEAATLRPPITTEAPTTEAVTEPDLELLPNGCPADFDVHLLLPHETRCNEFYYCLFGKKVARECAPGTYFNFDIQACDWAANVNCVNAESSEDIEGSAEDSLEDLEGSGDPDIDVDELLPNGCPADFDTHKLLPHESDCSKFYYCVLGETVERQCTNGYFNPKLQVCDHAENVNCVNDGSGSGEGSGSAEESGSSEESAPEVKPILPNGCPADFDVHQLLPHESDCGKFYYCVFGEKQESSCWEGGHFNAVLQVCDWPQNAGCANAGSGENESSGSGQEASEENNNSVESGSGDAGNGQEASNESTEENNANSSEEATTAPETEIDLLPNGCPADFDVHQLLPHESDCGKFYYCVFGEKQESSCWDGGNFNPVLQVCDWPANAGCANAGSGENESTGSSENENSNENGSGEDNSSEATTVAPETDASAEELLPNGCPADFDVHKLLPHEHECTKYYYCVHGQKVERECSGGNYFNPKLQVCDFPANVMCVGGAGSSLESTKEEDSSEEAVGPVLPNGCPSDFNVHQLLPHESDCGKFYYCVFGDKQESSCWEGGHFNPVLQVCDWPANAGCTNAGGENESSGSAENENSQEASEENNNTEESGANESAENGNSQEASEETGNSEENSSSEEVTASPETTPEAPEIELLPNGCPADFDVHRLLPHESDCGKFYYCVFGKKQESSCWEGGHFNPVLQVCDWAQNAGCANTGSSENENSNENGSGEGSSEATTVAPETDATTAPEAVLPNGCPADFDIHQLLPHESDCGKFYFCVFGEKQESSCWDGGHFNPILQVCDWPQNAGCANAGSEENNGSSENNSGEDNSSEEASTTEAPAVLPNGCPADFDVHQLLPHESDCGKFYFCVFGEKQESSCWEGGHFNPVLQTCDWPQNAGCANAGSGESAENGNSQETSAENNTSEETAASESAENGNSEETGDESDKCKNSCNVPSWAHEHDCDKFWRCDGENAVLGTCSEGLHFNVNTQTCDFICNAGCVRDDVQSTPEHDGLKLFLPWDKVDNTIRKLYLSQKQR